jgi:serine/threonine-protein kinase HipA
MRRTVHVHLGEAPDAIGLLHHDKQGARESAAFEYDSSWLRDPDRYAIDPALPLVTGPQFHRRAGEGSAFHRAIADTEPDGWGRRIILRDHVKRREAARRRGEPGENRPLDSLDFLLAVDDASRVGALRFRDEAGVFRRASEPGRRTAPPLIELGMLLRSSRAVETSSETLADLDYLRGRGTSLGGLRPKCTILDDDGQLAIGKFPSVQDERAVTKGEILALVLAGKAGIDAAQARLVSADDTPVAVIRRFDRSPRGTRIGYISAATLIGAELHDGAEHAYTEIVDALRVHGEAPQADLEELWRRIAFFIAITNVDDHLMNHGFLYAGNGRWRLAPAFDVNPFPERVRELKTWISEDQGPDASIESLLAVAPYFQIKAARAKQILAEVERAVARWRQVGRTLGMTQTELEQFADAFEHEERATLRRLLK